MRETQISGAGLTQVTRDIAVHNPLRHLGRRPCNWMELKMFAAVSLVSLIVGLVALAWAQGRASESLQTAHPGMMSAAAGR
jgi:hypothetical protein